MPGRKRTVQLKLFVNEEEAEKIKANIAAAGAGNFSAYARKMLLDGEIVHVDMTEIKRINRNLSMIGNNINQIARKANENDFVDVTVIDDLLREWKDMKRYYSEMMKKFIKKPKRLYK